MRVILLQDVDNLGKKNEIKDVKDGYAINFLIPKGLAKMATKNNFEELKKQKKTEEEKAKEELEKIQVLATKLDGQEITFTEKVSDEGKLFGSITPRKICSELKKSGFDVKQKQINISTPIKTPGDFPVTISLPHNLEAEITVIVTEE